MAQSLTVWIGLTKAVEKDKTIADRGTSQSSVRGMEDDSGERARELAKKQSEELSLNDAESMKEYIAHAKSLALDEKYHDIEVTEHEISRRVLNGLPPSYARQYFVPKIYIFGPSVWGPVKIAMAFDFFLSFVFHEAAHIHSR